MTDVNWLFSACAQTAGAIVAIVGGLLASRAVRLDADRKRIKKALKEADRLSEIAADRCVEALDSLREWASHRFGADVMNDILALCRDAQSDMEVQEPPDPARPISEVIEEIRTATQIALPVSVFLRGEEGKRLLETASLDDLSPRFTSTMSEPEGSICERVFRAEVERARRRGAAEQASTNEASSRSTDTNCMSDLGTLEYTLILQRLDHAERRLVEINLRIASSIDESIRLDDQPNQVYPWLILVHLSVFGIAIPLSLLPGSDVASAMKWVVLGPFLFGLGMLLLYFARMFSLRLDSLLPARLGTRARSWWTRRRKQWPPMR